jgi:hypothetical protein
MILSCHDSVEPVFGSGFAGLGFTFLGRSLSGQIPSVQPTKRHPRGPFVFALLLTLLWSVWLDPVGPWVENCGLKVGSS